jgi:hypothetical protein
MRCLIFKNYCAMHIPIIEVKDTKQMT